VTNTHGYNKFRNTSAKNAVAKDKEQYTLCLRKNIVANFFTVTSSTVNQF